jgi:hypothetical protein
MVCCSSSTLALANHHPDRPLPRIALFAHPLVLVNVVVFPAELFQLTKERAVFGLMNLNEIGAGFLIGRPIQDEQQMRNAQSRTTLEDRPQLVLA